MSHVVIAMRDALIAAIGTVSGVSATADLGAVLDPPAAIVGPPTLAWSLPQSEPSEATFAIALVVAAEATGMPRLYTLLDEVVDAIDSVEGVGAITAQYAPIPAGGTELPAYLIEVECALRDR